MIRQETEKRPFAFHLPYSVISTFAFLLVMMFLQPLHAVEDGPALKVDASTGRHPISPNIYGINFAEEVSGRTLFVLRRPAASAPSKAPAPGVDTNPAPAEVEQ